MFGRGKMELSESSHILREDGGAQPHFQKAQPQPPPADLQLEEKNETKSKSPGETPCTTPDISNDTYQLVGDGDFEKKDKSNIPMASFNFINSIIGSGIIGIPFALRQAGFGLGLILIVLVAVITDYSVVLLIHGGNLSNTNTYQDLVRAAFGRPGFYALTFMQGLYPFIAMISYNVIIGDTITKIVIRIGGESIRWSILGNRQFIIAVCTIVVTLPLSLYRNISRLSKISLISVVFTLFIVFVLIGKGFDLAAKVPTSDDGWEFANTQVAQSIGIMAFAYMCHHNSFLIYDSLENNTQERWSMVTHLSVIFAMVCTLIFGITGYATFTGFTQGDLLENYCANDDLVNVVRFVFALTIMLTYPIECFVVREVIENAIFANTQPQPLKRHIIETVIIVILTVIISMATDCLGIVLQVNGVLAAAPLAFIIPPFCVMRLQQEAVFSLKNIPCILISLFGIVVMVVGVVMTILDIVNGITCSHGEEMPYCMTGNTTLSTAHAYLNTSSRHTTTPAFT
ncbi:putative sodium-coupled neutral amino acid transporter 11 isoform X2 [Lineus longissimus]|uniref:putative sodium-coupled neutral amino acid transporter 11 isoform X2 n=1 Tax=Lineus longissimus TaxID=88925 RepID=UPI00315C6E80